ncbi:tetratricopeptide repeat protein [bacterium]|nr:tetratricopeptide repeat protein [bacterium]
MAINRVNNARLLYDNGQYTEALNELRMAVGEGLVYPDLYNLMGLCHSMRSEHKVAVGYFHKALELNADYEEARVNLSITLSELGQYEEAHKELVTVFKASEGSGDKTKQLHKAVIGRLVDSYQELARLELEFGRLEQAQHLIEIALELAPRFTDLHTMRASILRRRELNDEARKAVSNAILINPRYDKAYLELGIIELQTGELEKAKEHFEKARELSGDDETPRVDLYLAYLKSQAE